VKYASTNRIIKGLCAICACLLIAASFIAVPAKAAAVQNNEGQSASPDGSSPDEQVGALHAFYSSNASFSGQVKKYIDELDSLSFAWSRIDSEEPGTLNITKGKNGNNSFYYPAGFIQPVEYAKSKGKPIQLSIYMDRADCTVLLPYEDKRKTMVKAIVGSLQTDISQGKEIYYDGVVIDFEGLRNTSTDKMQLLYEGKPISTYFTQFLTELKAQLAPLEKKLYVAVNPGLYYDGYDYAAIIDIADRVILMAHDYEPVEKLQKQQVQQYIGYNALEPIHSMAPIQPVRQALNEMKDSASDLSELSKVWLQITFDSAQWRFDVKSAAGWESLADTALSREGRLTPLYKSIKDRVDNADGNGQNITYGYNNELQTPYLQYFNSSDESWSIILYEDSNSIRAKIELAKSYGLGGISLWSLANVPDYTDSRGLKYHLDGWTAVIDEMNNYDKLPAEAGEYVTFKDAAVEQAVRDKLGKTTGKITVADVQSIYRLKLPQGVKGLADLKYLTNLEYLDAQQLGLKAVTDIGKLINLRVLYLQRNNISDISALKKLTKLEVLSLNGNQMVSISALSSLTKLRELYLRENKIESITSLAKLTGLEILEAGMNSINKIDAVKNLKKLRQLSLDNNKVQDIQALKSLTGLQTLYLQRNSISSVSPLSGLKSLKFLSLNGNKITDLKPLTKLTSLEELYLKENKIASVTPLKGLTNLKELYLAGNPISDYSPLKKLYLTAGFHCDFKVQ
jgi:internalin A